MSGGSAKPGRRKAAGSSLRYEHRPGRPASGAKKRMTVGEKAFGCLVLPGFVLLIMPLVFFKMHWGHDVWGELAPGWPGGAYAFAATVGALVPLVFLAWVVPLTRMTWKKSKPRSLAWAAASLPGLAACYLVAGVIGAYARPKHRSDWGSRCYGVGGPCWTHERYPYLWVVGLAATLAVIVLLIGVAVKYSGRSGSSAEASEPAPASRPSTTGPSATPTPCCPTRTPGRRRPG